jgi:hypothetical protein
MVYVVMTVISSMPILLGLAALKQMTEAQPPAATAPSRRRPRQDDPRFEVRPPRD